jgi:hypothetical protein
MCPGLLADTPNKKCTFLVADSIGSAKTQKAIKDGIDIVSEEWVHASVKAGKMSTDKKLFLSGGGGASAAAAADDDDDEDDAEEDDDEDMTPASKKKKAAPAKKAPAAKKAAAAAAPAGGKAFAGLTFCVSGNFTLSQSEMRDLIVTNGGKNAATPNRSCNYLVADSLGSSKTAKAISDGLPIVTEEWVQQSIKAGKPSTDAKLFLSGAPGAAAADDDDEEEDDEPAAKPAAKRAGTKRKAASSPDPANDPKDPIDADGTSPAAADTVGKRQKSSKAGSGAATSSGSDPIPTPNIKTVVIKGGKGSAPVDEKVPPHVRDSVHVHQEGTEVYDACLNQTNVRNSSSVANTSVERASKPEGGIRGSLLG